MLTYYCPFGLKDITLATRKKEERVILCFLISESDYENGKMYKGKPVEQLSVDEWKAFTEEVVNGREINAQEKIRLEEEKKSLDAAKQLATMGGRNSSEQSITNTVIKGTIGNLSEFVPNDNWSLWFERFQQYCVVNEVPSSKHVSLFVTLMGKESYELLRNLCSPTLPVTLSLSELEKIMKEHLQPTPCVIMERYKFKECRQQQSEDVKTYLANLKRLSKDCDFGTGLGNSLRDQFVWGIASEAIKKRLLGEKDLTYQKAFDIAQSMEAATWDAAKMQIKVETDTLNYVKDKRQTGRRPSKERNEQGGCFCCGRTNHRKAECRFKEFKCKQCGMVGHLQAMCRSKKTAIPGNQSKQRAKKTSGERQDFLEEENGVDTLTEAFDSVFSVSEGATAVAKCVSKNSEPLYLNVEVEGKPLCLEIDTGSPVSAIFKKIYSERKNLHGCALLSTKRIFKTYHEQRLIPRGVLRIKVKQLNKEREFELFVMPGNAIAPIMG